jgi:hypothetical protein
MMLARGTRFLPPHNPLGRQTGLGQFIQLIGVHYCGLSRKPLNRP